jgi:NADH-quinone oxidoreductase chain G
MDNQMEKEMVSLKINGKDVSVPPRTTILQAAQENGIYIPHLCYDRRLKPYGGCRLCLVEAEGSPKLLAACSTPVTKDMAVLTETEKLAKARRTVLELLLVFHPLDCPVCDKAGECELQDLAFKYGPSESRFKGERKHGPELLAAPLVERNPNRCILCGKCVRICIEHQGVGAINLIGRGFNTIVSPAFEETLDCEFCGQCIDACPVGALGSKPYRFRSRVWFMDEKNTVCPHCGCGCTVSLGIREGRVIRSVGKDGAGISKGDLCGKGRFGFDFLYSEKRLSTPMIRKGDGLKPATWEEALEYVSERLMGIREKHGPSAIGAIGSQRCSVEDNYMLQKFMRQVVGTYNIDSLARFGYASAHEAVKKAFGLNALPIRFDSPLESDVILVVESDITSTHPVFGLNILRAARDMDAKLIVMDPKMTKLSRHSTEWLRNRPGTSVAALNGMMKVMLEEGLYDREAEKLPNFSGLTSSLEGFSAEEVEKITGIDARRLADAARAFAGAKNRLLCLTLGDHENNKGTDTALAAANLLILAGSGPEALQMPAELSNTMGMFQAGIRPDAGPGHSALEDAEKGLDLRGMLYADDSPIKALYIMGENPVVSFPRANAVESKLRDLELLVVQDIILTDTATLAHVVLPASSWSEKDGTFVGATGMPQRAVNCVAETGLSIPDWKILRNLSRYMQQDAGVGGLEELRAEIAARAGFEFDASGAERSFNPVEWKLHESTDDDYPFSMVTGILMQHSGSLTTISKSLGTVVSDAYLQINGSDAEKLKVADDSFVKVTSRRGEVLLKARVTDEVPEGMLFVPSHFPHARVNALTYPSSNGEPHTVAVSVSPAV